MDKIRSFIAIEIPGNVKGLLNDVIKSLKTTGNLPVKWVEPDNIHITLKFLGDIDASQVEPVQAVLQESVAGFTPFRLEVNTLGMFPNEKRPKIAWAGLSGDMAPLLSMQQKIENGLEKIGFGKESRKFSPHLTIARVRDHVSLSEQARFGEAVKRIDVTPESFTVDAVRLMKSQLTRQGPIYSQLVRVSLG